MSPVASFIVLESHSNLVCSWSVSSGTPLQTASKHSRSDFLFSYTALTVRLFKFDRVGAAVGTYSFKDEFLFVEELKNTGNALRFAKKSLHSWLCSIIKFNW